MRYDDTARWIFDSPVFMTWQNSSQSQGLCCRGIPGSGKSILAASVVNFCMQYASRDGVVCLYHYCDYAEMTTLNPRQAVGSLLKQTIIKGIPANLEERIFQVCDNGYKDQDVDSLSSLLKDALEAFEVAYIAIDGLDECLPEDAHKMLGLLEGLLTLDKPAIKALVTCRDEDLVAGLTTEYLQIRFTETSLAADLSIFVQRAVDGAITQKRLKRPGMRDEIISQLTSKAHGM